MVLRDFRAGDAHAGAAGDVRVAVARGVLGRDARREWLLPLSLRGRWFEALLPGLSVQRQQVRASALAASLPAFRCAVRVLARGVPFCSVALRWAQLLRALADAW